MLIKIEDIETTLGISLRVLHGIAAAEYPKAYMQVVSGKADPHPRQYKQAGAIECNADPFHDRRELPGDRTELMRLFQQARKDNGGGAPEMGTLAQAQASGLAFNRALKRAGHLRMRVY